jgi:hypothetical protein
MRVALIEFTKTARTTRQMEDTIMKHLSEEGFKYAEMQESNGKICLNLFTEGEAKSKVKVFRETFKVKMEKAVNDFLAEGHKMRMYKSTICGSVYFGILFFE